MTLVIKPLKLFLPTPLDVTSYVSTFGFLVIPQQVGDHDPLAFGECILDFRTIPSRLPQCTASAIVGTEA